jgi:ketosteroid isomerase-like protein
MVSFIFEVPWFDVATGATDFLSDVLVAADAVIATRLAFTGGVTGLTALFTDDFETEFVATPALHIIYVAAQYKPGRSNCKLFLCAAT